MVGIILANLIVGLTVNKTEELFEKADTHFNIKRVRQITLLESMLLQKRWRPKAFQWFGVQLLPRLKAKFVADNNKTFKNIHSAKIKDQ